jgi:ankyrin repeat protein
MSKDFVFLESENTFINNEITTLITYYSSLKENPSLILKKTSLKGDNIFHTIAKLTNDAPYGEELLLVSKCLEFVFENTNKYGATNLINKINNSFETPVNCAIEANNIFFLKALFINKNIANIAIDDIWDSLQDELPSGDIQKFLLENYFGVELDNFSLCSEKDQEKIIKKMEKNQAFFVMKFFYEHKLNFGVCNSLLAEKIIGYKDLELLSTLTECGIKYFNISSEDLLLMLGWALNENMYDENIVVIKVLLGNTNSWGLAEYNKLIKSLPEICLHSDSRGNNIFHKIASLSQKNNDEKFDQLMYETLGIIINYLNNHDDNQYKENINKNHKFIQPKNIINCANLSQRTAVDIAIEFNRTSFIQALMKIDSSIIYDLEHLDDIDMPLQMRQCINNLKMLEVGIQMEELAFEETRAKKASIMIEMSSKRLLVTMLNLFMEYEIDLNFQSFSYKQDRQSSGACNTLLHKAAQWGDERVVQKLLDRKVNINLQNREGFTPLAIASSLNDDSVTELLLEAGADVNKCTNKGTSILHFAVINNNESFVELLLEKYWIDLDKQDENGNAAMHFAVLLQYWNFQKTACTDILSNIKIINFLFKAKADINIANNNGESPLHLVAMNATQDHKELLTTLLKLNGICINQQDNKGNTAAHYAAVNNNTEMLEMIYSQEIELNRSNKNIPSFFIANNNGFYPLELLSSNDSCDWLGSYLSKFDKWCIGLFKEYYSKGNVIKIINVIEKTDSLFLQEFWPDKEEKTQLCEHQYLIALRLEYLFQSNEVEENKKEKLKLFFKEMQFDESLIMALFECSGELCVYKSVEELECTMHDPLEDEEFVDVDFSTLLNQAVDEELEKIKNIFEKDIE